MKTREKWVTSHLAPYLRGASCHAVIGVNGSGANWL